MFMHTLSFPFLMVIQTKKYLNLFLLYICSLLSILINTKQYIQAYSATLSNINQSVWPNVSCTWTVAGQDAGPQIADTLSTRRLTDAKRKALLI